MGNDDRGLRRRGRRNALSPPQDECFVRLIFYRFRYLGRSFLGVDRPISLELGRFVTAKVQ